MTAYLQSLDANVCYGPMVTRSRVARCNSMYQGRECTLAEVENTPPTPGEIYFGLEGLDGSWKSKMTELFSRIAALEESEKEHAAFKKSQDWINQFAALGTTPAMIVASKVGRVQEKAQREFKKMLSFVQAQPRLSAAYKALKNGLGVTAKDKALRYEIEEFCYRVGKVEAWEGGAWELAKFIYTHAMQATGGADVAMSEWAWYYTMLQERHKGGHPDALQQSDSEARLKSIDALYDRLQVEDSPVGFPDPCISKFPKLVCLAPRSTASSESLLLAVNFYEAAGVLPDTFQMTSTLRSFRRTSDLSEADMVILDASDACGMKKLLFESLGYGVKTGVVVEGPLSDYVKGLSIRNRLSISIAAPGKLEAEMAKIGLAVRPTNELPAVLTVSQVVHISDNVVEVVGRVNEGLLTDRLTLTTNTMHSLISDEELEAYGLKVNKLQVLHDGPVKASPGTMVSLLLEGDVAGIKRGSILADFRNGAWKSRTSFRARVTAAEDVVRGTYTLFCRNSEYEVEVEVEERMMKTSQKSFPASELAKDEAGVVLVTSKERLFVKNWKPGSPFNSYSFSRFVLKNNGAIVLAGVVLPEGSGGGKAKL